MFYSPHKILRLPLFPVLKRRGNGTCQQRMLLNTPCIISTISYRRKKIICRALWRALLHVWKQKNTSVTTSAAAIPQQQQRVPNHTPTIGQAAALINLGLQQRTTALTAKNDISSRSHTVLTITLEQRGEVGLLASASTADFATMAGRRAGSKARSKLVLVDLAGSERGRRSTIYVQQGALLWVFC